MALPGVTGGGSPEVTPPPSIHKPKAAKKQGRVVVFSLQGVDADLVHRGTLTLRRKQKWLPAQAIRRALASGSALRTRLPRRWLSGVSTAKRPRLARKTRLELAGPLRVGLVANAQGYFPNSERIL
ncbi:MAG: hypothetical protein ACREX8_09025, partial [Gammaproteobacteria bacterium]